MNKTDQTKKETKPAAPPPTAMPPMPPENTPIALGATTATVRKDAPAAGRAETVTLRLKRVLKAPPERVYQAFLDPDALAKWLPPDGFLGKVHHMDAKPGGGFRMSFRSLKGWVNPFGGRYVELVANKRIVYDNFFETDDPAMKEPMRVTVTLTAVAEGTLLEVEQAGIPMPVASGSPYGWAQSLDNLARIVEPELPF